MKIKTLQLEHYKSIIENTGFHLASDITILAGKNESGKTAILEAIRDFDGSVTEISESVYHIANYSESFPLIQMRLALTPDEISKIINAIPPLGDKEIRSMLANDGIRISKDKDCVYWIDNELRHRLEVPWEPNALRIFEGAEKKFLSVSLNSLLGDFLNSEGETDTTDPLEAKDFPGPTQLKELVGDRIVDLEKAQKIANAPPLDDEKKMLRKEINEAIREYKSIEALNPANMLEEYMLENLPNIVLMSDFDDQIPFEIPLTEISTNQHILDFAAVSGLSIEELLSITDTQRRRNLLSKHSASITGEFKGYWEQNKIELKLESDGDNLRLGVVEDGNTLMFKSSQRSKGFQWFLSFFLRLSAQRDKPDVILIDEPGLYLHAKAQKDVLRVLKTISKDTQIIISTHSPYLMDADRMDRIKLVLKEEGKTIVQNKPHHGADNETMTPIYTAIGLDLTASGGFIGQKNVVLEGMTDYYYLQAFKLILGVTKKNQFSLIGCVGASKVSIITSLLMGWGLDNIAVLDNDREGKAAKKELLETLGRPVEKVIMLSNTSGKDCSIEDLFSIDDFYGCVTDKSKPSISKPNSEVAKERGFDKVVAAKSFFEKAEKNPSELKLSDETKKNFDAIFKQIEKAFEN